MNTLLRLKQAVATVLLAALPIALMPGIGFASSHMDAPLIILDPAANTTDVYAFVDEDNGQKSLVLALGVYPHQEPGIGPNKYNFDDNVLYEIHVALGADRAAGRATLSYQFRFNTTFKNRNTVLQSYLGVIQHVDDANQNLTQTYTVTKVDHRTNRETVLGTGVVPPNNQGNATPYYNQGDNGENPARDGVATEGELDRYTKEAITSLSSGYVSFAGQRDDGFYADIQSIFDLLQLRNPGKDSQGGFNLDLMALEVPMTELGGDQQVVGVYATTSRRTVRVLDDKQAPKNSGPFVQVARQGNPLFNEGLVAIADKDLYSRTSPTSDSEIFRKYAETPELAHLINLIVFKDQVAPETNRSDIAGIYIPDLIKVDLSTTKVRFAGGGPANVSNPDDPDYSRLSIFGGDVLKSNIQDPFHNGGFIPGGWPNGRRFGDDVVDIAVTALISDLRDPDHLIIRGPAGDGVDRNDMAFNKVFPYESTPQNGRNHEHP
ncbi:MAG TPA: DUF4331 domain-containing protein [Pyrinomonadaceae bacterium]|jgi:hypothetical protein|nr:DUF4331 domain-containing protein [Pyrinomonadaceae bacterium]